MSKLHRVKDFSLGLNKRAIPLEVYRHESLPVSDGNFSRLNLHKHAELEICLCLDGPGTFYIEDESYLFNKHDLFILNAGTYHQPLYRNAGNAGALCLYFSYELTDSEESLSEWKRVFNLSNLLQIRQLASCESIRSCLESLGALTEDPTQSNKERIKGQVAYLMSFVIEAFDRQMRSADSRVHVIHYQQFLKALDHINQNIASKLDYQKIYALAGMSKSQFALKFKTVFGMTLNAMIAAKRIKRARTLLLHSNKSILNIANDSGYQSLAHFNAAFKKHTGQTPSAFRKAR